MNNNQGGMINSSEAHYNKYRKNQTGYSQHKKSLNLRSQHPPSTADVVFLPAEPARLTELMSTCPAEYRRNAQNNVSTVNNTIAHTTV